MATDFGVDPSVTSLLGQMDVYLMIVTNPDGYAYTHTNVSLRFSAKAEIVTTGTYSMVYSRRHSIHI